MKKMSDVADNNRSESTEAAEIDLVKSPETGVVDGTAVVEVASITELVEDTLNSNDAIENTCHVKKLRKLQRESDKLHCPFYWQEHLSIRTYGDHEIDPLSEFEEMCEESSFTLRKFITHLITCYHNFYKRLVEDSLKNMDEMDKILCYSLREKSHDPLFIRIKEALLHVLLSCHVYILGTTNQVERALQVLEKMKPYEAMDKANRAAIWGIRAAVYVEYGYEATKTAIEYMGKAVRTDSGNVFWPFLRGLYLGRLRRMEKASFSFSEKEILSLENAIKKHEDPVFYSFTAETYLEIVESIEKNSDSDSSTEELSEMLDKFTKKAAEYFKKSVDIRESNVHLLFRYGQSLMRLREPYQDLEKAEKLFLKGLKVSPNSSYGNHAMAMYMMHHKRDSEAAELYLEKSITCNNFRAHIELCRKWLLEDEHSAILELKKLLDVYKEIPKVCKIYGELICYHLFLHYNLLKACEYAKSLIDLQTTWIKYIYEFNSSIFPFSHGVPLIELLVAEIRNELHRESTAEVEKNGYKNFIHYLLDEEIQVPKSTTEDLLLRHSEDMEENLRKQREFPVLKTSAKKKKEKKKILNEEKHRGRGDKEYRKYYIAQKNRCPCDIVPPHSPSEIYNRKKRSKTEEVQQKHRYGPSRRHHSRSSSESSTNDCETLKRLAEDLDSVLIVETDILSVKNRDALNEERSDSSSDRISFRTIKSKKYISPERKSSNRSKGECHSPDSQFLRSSRKAAEKSDDSRSSSSEEKSSQSNRYKKKVDNTNSDRESASSKGNLSDGLRNLRETRSPYSTSERKSSRSHRENHHRQHRRRDDRSSSSSSSRCCKSNSPVTDLRFDRKMTKRNDDYYSSSPDRQSRSSSRSKKKLVSRSPNRKSKQSDQHRNDDSRYDRRMRSPGSSYDRKSSRSECKYHNHQHQSRDNSSSSCCSTRSCKSKSFHEYQNRENKSRCSERSRGSVESSSRRKHCEDLYGERPYRKQKYGERSYSSDSSRHHRRGKNNYKQDRSRQVRVRDEEMRSHRQQDHSSNTSESSYSSNHSSASGR